MAMLVLQSIYITHHVFVVRKEKEELERSSARTNANLMAPSQTGDKMILPLCPGQLQPTPYNPIR